MNVLAGIFEMPTSVRKPVPPVPPYPLSIVMQKLASANPSEFCEAGMASATFSSKGEIGQKHARRFAAISSVTYGPHGIIAEQSRSQS
jgi:hypothetical protein